MAQAATRCNRRNGQCQPLRYHLYFGLSWCMLMKTRNEITIDADRETVWREFDNADNMCEWQPTLKSFTHKSGTPGEPGAVSELVYDENGRDVTMIETMTEKRRPDFMAGSYDSAWSRAIIVNHFEAVGDEQTRWVIYANHQFKGFFRIIGLFFRKSICGRTDEWMQRFKLLVETRAAGEAR